MKKVLFCMPGREYSGSFLKCWTALIHACYQREVLPILSQTYSPVVYFSRSLCLGADYMAGPSQKPFQGKIDYDYIMWIDSDIVFQPDDFFNLLALEKDIASGLYIMADNTHYPVVETWDQKEFITKGRFKFLTRSDMAAKTGPFKVSYAGMGWMLVKNGVMESLEYPWFRPLCTEITHEGKTIMDLSSEDAGFCRSAGDQGYDVWVDPRIIVGHEKKIVL